MTAGSRLVDRSALIVAAVMLVLASCVGFALARAVNASAIGRPEVGLLNVFYVLFGAHEQPFFVIAGLAALLAIGLVTHKSTAVVAGDLPIQALHPALPAAVVFVVAWGGSHLVLHGFPLAMDEYNAVFQAEIFATGKLAASVPYPWSEIAPAIKPEYVTFKPDAGVWLSSYLPVYAAIRAPFAGLGLNALLNPVLASLAIAVIALVARRMWPNETARAPIAVLLLLTSSQFLLTSMSWYAMPAHLLLNLVWLNLYLRGGRWDVLALIPVGILALGLHNPFPHALFVAPFLIRLLRQGHFGRCALLGSCYGGAAVLWWVWLRFSLSPDQTAGVGGVFGLPTGHDLLTQAMSFLLILSWQSPLLGLGLLLGLSQWRSLSEIERDLAAGFVLTCLFFVFFKASQGHGWGYRYIYGVLGNGVLVATVATSWIAGHLGPRITRWALVGSCIVALAIQLPIRALQANRFGKPWARASEYLSSLPSDAVAIPASAIWYGYDLSRTRPFLSEREAVVLRTTSSTVIDELIRNDASVIIVACSDLVQFGLSGNCSDNPREPRGNR